MRRVDVAVQYFRSRFLSELADWRSPSLVSFLLLGALVGTLFLLARPVAVMAHFPSLEEMRKFILTNFSDEDGHISASIAGTFGALAVVVIALVVFVAESMRDDADQERRRVLLKLSLLWPLGLLATLIPLGFLWAAASPLVVALELAFAALTIYAFARLISNLLSPVLREKQRRAFLEGRVKNVIRESAKERVANNVLAEQVGPGKLVEAFDLTISRGWLDADGQAYIFVDAPSNGRLVDIQVEELKRLGDRINWLARTYLGFSLVEDVTRIPNVESGNDAAFSTPLPLKKAFLLKRFGEEIPETSIFHAEARSVLALPEEFAQRPGALAEVEAALSHIFRFSSDEASSTVFRRELQATKDELVAAISSQAISKVDELRSLYLSIAEQFLETLVELGGGYSADQAEQERLSLGGDWDEVGWLQTDLRELIAVALGGESTTIAGKIGYLPFAIAARAVRARDHLLFQQFLAFAGYEYFLSRDIRSTRLREYIIERTWRWPKELADFYVERLIVERRSTVDDVTNGLQFALYVIRVFQDLIKDAADNDNAGYFGVVFGEFLELFEGVHREVDDWSVDEAIQRGRHSKLLAELIQADASLEKAKAQVYAKQQIEIGKRAVALAINGRLITAVLGGRASARPLLDIATRSLSVSLRELLGTFAYSTDGEAASRWGWDFWDLPSDGKVHSIDTQTAVSRALVVRLLSMLAADSNLSKLPVESALSELARDDHPYSLPKLLDQIDADKATWGKVLSSAELAETGRLRSLIAELRREDLAAEVRRTRSASLDEAKVDQFATTVIASYQETARIRKLLVALGVQIEQRPETIDKYLGYHQIDDKRAFIRQDRSSYFGWGKSYGQGLARSEDAAVLRDILSSVSTKEPLSSSPIVEQITAVLDSRRYSNPVILHSLGFRREYYDLANDPAFVKRSDVDTKTVPLATSPSFVGAVRHRSESVPVFSTRGAWPTGSDFILVADLKRLISWTQFNAASHSSEAPKVYDNILIDVIDLNLDAKRRADIVKADPGWLKSVSDKDGYLRERVVVRVLERFEIEIADPAAGVLLEAT
jgi:hypothetical protein